MRHITHDFVRISHKKALIALCSLLTACSTTPRTAERQANSDSCWGAGHTSAVLTILYAPIKPIACIIVDQTQGQTQYANTGTTQRYITPIGSYQVNRTGTTTVITQTAK